MLFGGRQLINYINSKTHITVSGTVYGKYVGQEHHRNYTNDIFIMAVHPYDKKYKDYSVTVDYSTFAKFDKGDNIAFVKNIFEVTDKSKYFGMLITEAKYGDLPDFQIVESKY